MGEMEDASNYMMYQNADLKDLHSTDGSSYGQYGVQSDPVTYATTEAPESAGDKAANGVEEVKELTELEKYWKTVRDNSNDFTGWTYLLQFVEQENNVDNAREAFQEFFKTYPYCYGYWKKLADLEKKNQNIEKCVEVFEQGLAAVPLSVDLWLHYIAFCRQQETGDDAADKMRVLFEKAIKATGLEFRSDRLWEIYVAFEVEQLNYRNAMAVYQRLINTPTQLYSHQFEKFEEFLRTHHPRDILDPEELATLVLETKAAEIKKDLTDAEPEKAEEETAVKDGDDAVMSEASVDTLSRSSDTKTELKSDTLDGTVEPLATEATDGATEPSKVTADTMAPEMPVALEGVYGPIAPVARLEPEQAATILNGELEATPSAAEDSAVTEASKIKEQSDAVKALSDEVPKDGKADTVSDTGDTTSEADSVKMTEEQVEAIRSSLVEKMRVIHKANEEEVSKRWNFEEGIKRPYFHVKPLETTQLSNWREYLDFEIAEGNRERICILFERCLIACALYEDMWQKYIGYLEPIDKDATSEIYRRACTIHLRSKHNIQLKWASYEEMRGNFEKSAEVLEQMEVYFPGYLPITFRRINLTRRQNNLADTELLYKKYAQAAKSPQIASLYALKQARFRHKLLHDENGAVVILNEALLKDKDNARLYMQLIDIFYQSTPIKEELVVKAFDGALSSDMAVEAKILFAQRKVEFLEDLGSDINKLQEAYNELSSFVKLGADKRKRASDEEIEEPAAKRSRTEAVNGVVASTATAVAAAAAAAAVPAADQSAAYSYNWANYAQNYGYQNAWNMYGQQYYSQQ